MTQKMINFRMDEDMKIQMEEVCKEMGLSMSSAFIMFAKKVIRERRIPFEISADPFYSSENIMELQRRISNLEAGITSLKEHELIEADE
ncbi:MAG: type II toxin-antitoxin system RelB/DinJ family antitoxin [Erysipelotrichaceae bacterium]|nr:type II toxin-antitoxin system RelB/DinJ family antitoxin [Erysipelotrichaceae bacterium]